MTEQAVVLSTVEFDVLWEAERLGSRHVALSTPSPGLTHAERAEVVQKAWHSLADRGLARGTRADGELLDLLGMLATPAVSIDVWAWADQEVSGLAVSTGDYAVLGIVDGEQVWLVPARSSMLVESAVSVIGELGPGVGQTVSLPHRTLIGAAHQAQGDAHALITALQDRGTPLFAAQELAGMLFGQVARGQLGVQRRGSGGTMRRADRVVAYHDTDAGRYLMQLERNADGVDWCTVTPADNSLLAERAWELLAEL
ncbi:MAG: ESX secretion-associated protein EspG [Thermocrispum sp.]